MSTIVPAPGDKQDGNKRGREAISAGLRFDVLSRCNFACYYCGVPAALGLKALHVEHVIPVKLGGTNDPWNLVASCWDCNAGKAATMPTQELVSQVRDAYAARLQGDTGMAIVCNLCHLPTVLREGDEVYQTCASCVDRDIQIWDIGRRSGLEQATSFEPRF